MSKPFYQKEFSSTTAAVGKALDEALGVLADEGWCTHDNTFCIRLCLEEAFVNAVVHGNCNEPSRTVHVRMYADGDQCRVCVHDEGAGFDPASISMAECTELGGRGVCLIKEYMDDVHFNSVKQCLEMVFNRNTFCKACT